MVTILLVASALVASLLFTATFLALAGRVSSRLARWTLAGVAVGIPLLVLFIPATIILFALNHHRLNIDRSGFVALGVALAFLIPAILLSRRGLRRGEHAPQPMSGHWPLATLSIWLALALVILMFSWGLNATSARIEIVELARQASLDAVAAAPPRWPHAMDAFPLYKRACLILNDSSMADSLDGPAFERLRARGQAPDAATLEEVRKLLRPHLQTLDLLHQAAQRPGCFLDLDYSRISCATIIPELGRFRLAARLLQARALLAAYEGHPDAAIREVGAMAQLAEHLRQTPMFIVLLVATSVDVLASDTLEQVITIAPPSAADLQNLRLDPAPTDSRRLIAAVRLENASALATFARLAQGHKDRVGKAVLLDELPRGTSTAWRLEPAFWLQGIREYAATYEDLVAALHLPLPQQRLALERLEADIPSRALLVRLVFPAFSSAASAVAVSQQRRVLAVAALVALRYRLEHHRNPADVDDLSPSYPPGGEAPLDAFRDTPIRFLVRDDGSIVLYSIGPDGVDDHAKPFDNKTKTGDLTFTLPPFPAPKPR